MDVIYKTIEKRFRCEDINHTKVYREPGTCEECGKPLLEKWLPFSTKEKVSVDVFYLRSLKDFKIPLIQGYTGDGHSIFGLLTHSVDEPIEDVELMYIDIYRIKRKFDRPLLKEYKSTFEEWHKRYINSICGYNKRLFNLISEKFDISNFSYIILPQTKSPELRRGIEMLFQTQSKAVLINAQKLNPDEEAKNSKNYVKFKDIKYDFRDKIVLILDECISTYKTIYGVIEACMEVGINTKFVVGAYCLD